MRSKLITACISLVAFAACAAVPTIASASPELTEPTGTTLAPLSLIKATNIGETTFESSSTTVHCTGAELTGKVITNSGTHIAGEISSAHFTGSAPGGECTSGSGNVNVTETTPTNGLPWCVTSTKTAHQFELRGGACSAKARPIRFAMHITTFLGSVECPYEKTTGILGTFTTHPSDAVLSIANQSFKRVGENGLCPAEGSLKMSFTLETDTTASADPIWIS